MLMIRNGCGETLTEKKIDGGVPQQQWLYQHLLHNASAFNSGKLRKQVTFSLCKSALGGFHLVFYLKVLFILRFKGFLYINFILVILLVGGWKRLYHYFSSCLCGNCRFLGTGIVDRLKRIVVKTTKVDRLKRTVVKTTTVCIFGTSSLFWFWVPLNFHSYHPVLPSALRFLIGQYFYRYWEYHCYATSGFCLTCWQKFSLRPSISAHPSLPFPPSAHACTPCALELPLPAALWLGSPSSQLSAKMYRCTSEPFDVIALQWWGSSPVVLSALMAQHVPSIVSWL